MRIVEVQPIEEKGEFSENTMCYFHHFGEQSLYNGKIDMVETHIMAVVSSVGTGVVKLIYPTEMRFLNLIA